MFISFNQLYVKNIASYQVKQYYSKMGHYYMLLLTRGFRPKVSSGDLLVVDHPGKLSSVPTPEDQFWNQ